MKTPEGKVWANLLIDSKGATSVQGSSAPLRTFEDGKRFHQLRGAAKAIVIGGNTYRSEPYAKSPVPLFVASRKLPESSTDNLKIMHSSPENVVAAALAEYGAPVLIEAGPTFLTELLPNKVVDFCFISKVKTIGDDHFLSMETLQANYELIKAETEKETIFETWVPKH